MSDLSTFLFPKNRTFFLISNQFSQLFQKSDIIHKEASRLISLHPSPSVPLFLCLAFMAIHRWILTKNNIFHELWHLWIILIPLSAPLLGGRRKGEKAPLAKQFWNPIKEIHLSPNWDNTGRHQKELFFFTFSQKGEVSANPENPHKKILRFYTIFDQKLSFFYHFWPNFHSS